MSVTRACFQSTDENLTKSLYCHSLVEKNVLLSRPLLPATRLRCTTSAFTQTHHRQNSRKHCNLLFHQLRTWPSLLSPAKANCVANARSFLHLALPLTGCRGRGENHSNHATQTGLLCILGS